MKRTSDANICLINDNIYINRLANLHLSAFKGLLSGAIGVRFLRFFYHRIIKEGFIFACFEDEQIIGFVTGITDEKRIYNIKYYFCALLGIIAHIYDPRTILRLYRHILRIIKLRDVKIKAELLSIVVDEKSRGRGVGKALVESLNKFMTEKGVSRYKVFTDMKYSTGHRLYDRMGFILDREMNLAGLVLRMYIKELN